MTEVRGQRSEVSNCTVIPEVSSPGSRESRKPQIEPRSDDHFPLYQWCGKGVASVLLALDSVMTRVKHRFPVPGSKVQGPGSKVLALNASQIPDGCERLALNFELPADGAVPGWIELIPPGMLVKGRDGRIWANDPVLIVEAFKNDGRDIPLDWEHSTELQAPQGLPAPAAAWGKELQVREGGAVWGRFEWTPRGKQSVESREYRYISPVFVYEKESRLIRKITSAALTNQPNLALPALNQQKPQQEGDRVMWKALLTLLGLVETATEEQAMNAVKKIQGDLQTALNRAETPSLDKFVPRGDYDAALVRATNAETKLADRDKAELETAINVAVDDAMKAGKIAPASKDYYLATCRQQGGLDAFKKFLDTAPVIASPSNLDGKKPGEADPALNAEQKKIAEMFGNSVEDLKKYGSR